MLQVRAGHCPNCKEPTPPGAEFCPICGEDLGWQTVNGQKISDGSTRSGKNGPRKFVRNLIFLALLSLMAVIAFALRERLEPKPAATKPPANSITTEPEAGSTPVASDDANLMLDNALTDSENSTTDNATTDNAVSGSVDNAVSDSASTPTPTETPKAKNPDDLSDIEMP